MNLGTGSAFGLLLIGIAQMTLPEVSSDALTNPLPQRLYAYPAGEVETRWITPENPDGEKGKGGMENRGAKGHPFASIGAGETLQLLDIEGSGVITRIWITVSDRDPVALRSLRLDMYWDDAPTPAVSAPLGDFFGAINGKSVPMETELFANPEGKSFNCFIPMPYRKGARITVTNEASKVLGLITYEINLVQTAEPDDTALYFHAHWRRERWTTLGRDFEILPKVSGRGKFLGTHIGVIEKPGNEGWWGEGEVKIYLDGDDPHPTLVGTGTEDYIGSGWGQKVFQNRYTGSLFSEDGQIGFYRYHIPDPVYFREDCRVTIQVMGSLPKKQAQVFLKKEGVNARPVAIVSIQDGLRYTRLLEDNPDRTVDGPLEAEQEWVAFYREDDFSAVAFFYLDKPENGLPPLAPVEERTVGLTEGPSSS